MSRLADHEDGVGEHTPNYPGGLGTRAIREQDEWREFVAQNLGAEAHLLYVSPADNDRRIYRVADRMAKVQRRSASHDRYGQQLASEYEVLERLQRHSVFERHPVFEEHGEWEVLWCDYVDGEPLTELWQRAGLLRKFVLGWRTWRAVARLHREGVAHVDMQAPNYLGDEQGEIEPVDFGDAVLSTRRRAATADTRRFLFGRYGLMQRTAKLAFLRLWPNSQQIYRSFKLRRVEQLSTTSLTMPDEGEAAELLEAGWRRAARWNTTAGKWLAYSSLTVGGVHFPGWRPWFLRWTWIREAVTFEGKNVLDLGCSVGLFCCFALLEGAESAMGVDADASSLDAAQLIAAGLGVRPRFQQLRLGSSDGWQARLPSADIAVAMSIGEWVDDKKALFTFLSRFPELIYEGHGSLRIEHDRLRAAGFRHIEILGVTDRGRVLFHATR